MNGMNGMNGISMGHEWDMNYRVVNVLGRAERYKVRPPSYVAHEL